MQLSDVIKDTDAIDEAIAETKFRFYLKWLSTRPDWKKQELHQKVKDKEFSFGNLVNIFGEDEI